MKKHLSFRHALTAAAISLAAIASFAASAQAATDTIYKYTKPRTGYFMAHPFAMVPDGHAPDYEINEYHHEDHLAAFSLWVVTIAY